MAQISIVQEGIRYATSITMKFYINLAILAHVVGLKTAFAFIGESPVTATKSMLVTNLSMTDNKDVTTDDLSRRNFLNVMPRSVLAASVISTATTTMIPLAANAAGTPTGPIDGNLPDLPPNAVQSYLQYRIPLQIAVDAYLFDLQDAVADIDQWGEVSNQFRVNNSRGGQGQPAKIEREYVNTMRILLLSFPPDVAEDMRASQFKFEAAMNKVSKAVSGYRRDLPVEVDKSAIEKAKVGWEEGRVALNEFLALLNDATGLNEMRLIPAQGPNQGKEYGRSLRRYNDLVKKTRLCQNRGGPTLSNTWGALMVSGYLQDSCGIPDLEDYFYQG